MYRPVTRSEIADALIHIRDLYRQVTPRNGQMVRAGERRERGIKDLLSNLPRTKEHPTLNIINEVADMVWLTNEGIHQLFGYDLPRIREYDLRLNGGRTHLVDAYAFERDRLIDLPLEFASDESLSFDGFLGEMVIKWQSGIPIRALEEEGWFEPGTFFVHVGTEDSLGSSLPPGSLASVSPIAKNEESHPNPRAIYLLQFGNGYRCSRCVVSRGKLQLLASERTYLGTQNFNYPGAVRIVGRVRKFALRLPLPDYPSRYVLPPCQSCAALILPTEQSTRSVLFATEHKRFKRTKQEQESIRDVFRTIFGSNPSPRTERRYRAFTPSEPHVDSLIYFTITNLARYTDSLKAGGSFIADKGRFSLETLLMARQWADVAAMTSAVRLPRPIKPWEIYKRELLEWAPFLSDHYPELRLWSGRALRLANGAAMQGIEPTIAPGSWMVLERAAALPDIESEQRKTGWSRPIYVLRRGLETVCGYLERDGNQYALLSSAHGYGSQTTVVGDDLKNLWRTGCVLIPV